MNSASAKRCTLHCFAVVRNNVSWCVSLCVSLWFHSASWCFTVFRCVFIAFHFTARIFAWCGAMIFACSSTSLSIATGRPLAAKLSHHPISVKRATSPVSVQPAKSPRDMSQCVNPLDPLPAMLFVLSSFMSKGMVHDT